MSAQLSKKPSIFLLLIFVLLVPTASLPGQVTVLPRGSVVAGRTIPEWTAEWWKWSMALPATGHPWLDETGADALRGQNGPVVFLVGVVVVSGIANRSITIEDNKYLFFPINNAVNLATGENPWGTITEELRDGNAVSTSQTIGLQGSLNGIPLTNLLYTTGRPLTNLFRHREISPEFALWMPPTNNLFQYFGVELAGVFDPCVSDGFWLMLAPLPAGSHRLDFEASVGPPSNFRLQVTYQIAVRPTDVRLALTSLITRVTTAGLAPERVAPLVASLQSAQKSFASGALRTGINHLRVFQNKVRAQVADKILADDLIGAAQRIIDAATRRLP
jgi:hypothetical protein